MRVKVVELWTRLLFLIFGAMAVSLAIFHMTLHGLHWPGLVVTISCSVGVILSCSALGWMPAVLDATEKSLERRFSRIDI